MNLARRGLAVVAIAAAAGMACGDEPFVEEVEEAIFCGTGSMSAGRFSWREESASLEGTALEGMRVEIGTVEVPLDWCREDSRRIQLSVRRITAANSIPSSTRPQVWLLVGGPGMAGSHILRMVPFFAALEFEVLIPDYRGLGGSTPLQCDGDGSATVECMHRLHFEWGEQLVHFSTTNIALDLGRSIEALRSPGRPVFVYGSSYGTFLGNRYLSLFPKQADAVVLDGICPAAACDVQMDANHDRIIRESLEVCGGDPFCRSKLGADPAGTLADLLLRIGKGHCREALPKGEPAAAETVLLNTLADPSGLRLGLSFAYRLQRCEPEDVAALQHFFASLEEGEEHGEDQTSELDFSGDSELQYGNIVFSEFWDDRIDAATVAEESKRFLLHGGILEGLVEERARWSWPIYDTPRELRSWATTDTPLLLLNGTLDSRTTVAGLAGIDQVYRTAHQRFHSVPWTVHVTLRSEPHGEDGYHRCVGPMVRDFLLNPGAPVDASCLDTMELPPFEGDLETALATYGTKDLWENEPGEGLEGARLLLGEEALQRLEHLRRLVKGAPSRRW